MPVPSPRNSVRIARGNIADLQANAGVFGDGEIIYSIDEDIFYSAANGTLFQVGRGIITGESINALADVDTSTVPPGVGQVLKWDGANWAPADDSNTDAVTSVAGKTGNVTLVKADITDFADGDYATAAQGALADSATQPGDNISTLTNDAAYITSAGAPVQSVAGKTGAVTLVKADITDFSDADYATAAQGTLADGAVQSAGDTMTGALGMPVGSAASPSIYFDANTGIYSPGADQLAIATSGSERIRIGDNGEIGLGGANYGTSGQVLTSAGSGAAPTWATPAAGGASVTTSDTAPSTPADGDLWYDTVGGRTYVYYNDGNTSQWVDAAPQSGGSSTPTKIEVGNTKAEITDTGSNGAFAVTTEGTQRLIIDSSGRLGLGTSTPARLLSLYAASEPVLQFTNSTTGQASSDGTIQYQSGNNFVIDNKEAGTIQLTSQGTAALTVDSSRRVGIGTTSPYSLVDLGTSLTGQKLSLYADATYRIGMGSLPNEFRQYTHQGGFISWGHISTSDQSTFTERARITSSGQLLVGTSTATAQPLLGVTGSLTTNNGLVIKNSVAHSGSPNFVYFLNNTDGISGAIVQSGSTSVSYNTSSDYRLKENVVPLVGAADRLKQLPVRRFNFIAEPDKTIDGFIAHEAQAVVPECVTGTKDAVDADGKPVYQGIDQSKLVPLLTAALQEAMERIETLEAANTDLAARITSLEAN